MTLDFGIIFSLFSCPLEGFGRICCRASQPLLIRLTLVVFGFVGCLLSFKKVLLIFPINCNRAPFLILQIDS